MRTSFWLTLATVLLLISFGYSDEAKTKSETLDWPQWRGPNRDGISAEKGIGKNWSKNEPEIRWRISGGDGYSGISAANDKLFTMWDEGDSQFLFCLDSLSLFSALLEFGLHADFVIEKSFVAMCIRK